VCAWSLKLHRELHEANTGLMQPARAQLAINWLNCLIFKEVDTRQKSARLLLNPVKRLSAIETVRAHPRDDLRDLTMNAIDLLKADHERVKGILSQLSESTERGVKKRTELLAKLEMEISIHTRLEEEVLYPAFKKAGGKDQDVMYYEAKEEHRTVDSLVLPDLKVTDPSTPEFAGRVKVVKELLEHHIEEEETEMFPQANKLLGKATLEELGAQMETLKAKYKKELSDRNLAA
jgi:hemerythrin-like domain-containing protein